jgi:hypothetical protein
VTLLKDTGGGEYYVWVRRAVTTLHRKKRRCGVVTAVMDQRLNTQQALSQHCIEIKEMPAL